MKNLQGMYNEWRAEMEGFINEGLKGITDCGEKAVREDFTAWAGLEN